MAENEFVIKLSADLAQMESGLAKITNQLAVVRGGLDGVDTGLKANKTSADQAGQSTQKFSTSLNSTRYALYDVSRTLAVAGVALLGFAVLPSKVAIEFQRDFANVARTVQDAGSATRKALVDLTSEIPTSFKNITEIATLGGQLGEGADSIVEFTSVVAKLTATTDLSAEVAGTALGRFEAFGLVTSSQFGNLASAILKVGVNSVATESQIVTIATRIAGVGKIAGLGAGTLVGYAGALASVGVQAFAASGSTIRLVGKMQEAVAVGGDKLATFAKVAGVSTDEFRSAFGTEKFNPIFEAFIKNLGDTAITGKTTTEVLKDIGLAGAIDSRTFTQLAAAQGVVTQAFTDANTGIKDSATLNQQYGKIAETTAAKLQILSNNFQAFLAAIGGATTGPLTGFVELLSGFLKYITQLVSTPTGQWATAAVVGFTALAGVLALTVAFGSRAIASYIGLISALTGLEAASGGSAISMGALNTSLAATGPLGAKAAAGITFVGSAIKAAGLLAVFTGAAIGLNALIDGFREWTGSRSSVDDLTKSVSKAGDGYKKTIDSIVNAKGLFGNSGALGFGNAADTARQFKSLFDFMDGINSFNPGANLTKSFDTTGVAKFRDEIKKLDQSLSDEAGKNAGQTATQYAYLSQKLKDAGYSAKEIADLMPKTNAALKENQAEVKKAALAQIQLADSLGVTTGFLAGLQTETGLDAKGIQSYADAYAKSVSPLTDFNSIVGQVQASLSAAAEAQAKAAGGNAQASDFYNGTAVSLQQFTDQLNTNNAAQLTWAQNLIQLSQESGQGAADQFIQAGYSAVNSSILQQLVDATPAQRDAYIAAQEEAARLASEATASQILSSSYLTEGSLGHVSDAAAAAFRDGLARGIPVETLMNNLNLRFQSSPVVPRADTSTAQAQINSLVTLNNGRSITLRVNTVGGNVAGFATSGGTKVPYATGGPVFGPGTGTSDSINARLSNGEYVINAEATARNRALLDQINSGRSATPNHYANGGPVTSSGSISGGVFEMGPNTMNVFRAMIQREIHVAIGATAIAAAANAGNQNQSRIGAR